MSPTGYTFAVLDGQNRPIPVTFSAAEQHAKECFQSVWKRMSGAVEEFHKADAKRNGSVATQPDWVRWQPWDWCLSSKPEVANRNMIVGWCGTRMVGFLSTWSDFLSHAAPGSETLYIEHLAAFPGDLNTAIWGRHYKGVGKALMAYAVLLSRQAKFNGRLSLHASNGEALNFYRRLNTLVGGRLFHSEVTGVLGPTPQAARHDANRTFLETTEAGAAEWLEGYRDA